LGEQIIMLNRLLQGIALVASFCIVAGGAAARAASPGGIAGTVKTHDGTTVGDATVTLVQLSRTTKTDSSGTFRFDAVPPGTYLLEIVSPRHGSGVGQVLVADGATATFSIALDLAVHHEDVIVSAGVSPQSLADAAQAITVLDERELTVKSAPTLGETLGRETGVAETQYAPGASRPVIRGQGGDRIRILQNGVGVGDASNVSADHAVTIDPYSAERVEVVRGAATLLYGSNAIGGIVNVLDGSIPDRRTGSAFVGDVNLRYGSSSDLTAGAAHLGGDTGGFGWNVAYAKASANDLKVGSGSGLADDTVPNSDVDVQNWTAGASWLGQKAFVGGAFDEFTTNYGSAVESEVRIDMTQKRWNIRGGINEPFGPFRVLKATAGGTNYEHVELEGGEPGTSFFNKSLESRVELAHQQAGPWLGSFGLQLWHRDFEAVGEEAFVQPTTTSAGALFAYEELGRGAVKGQFGVRFERQDVSSDDPTLEDRTFGAPSVSAGMSWKNNRYFVSATLSSSSRVPTSEELYANGPHLATFSFELGDDTLDPERSLGFDVSLRKTTGRVSGQVDLFYANYDDYIYERDTGTTFTTGEGDVLPVIQVTASKAAFYGGEAHVDFELLHADPHHLELEVRSDYVHAELTDLNQAVPLQPPLRGVIGLKYQGPALWASIEGYAADHQHRFATFDTATPAYAWLNAAVGYRLIAGRTVHDVIVRGLNLTNKLSYNSVSRFRFDVPLPGRDVGVAYRLAF
jgi:iron complex outermembrane recepter protein